MPLKGLLKLIGLQPIPTKKPKAKKAKRRERQTEEWESIGYSFSYGMTEKEDLDQVPEWLKGEWNKVRGNHQNTRRKMENLRGRRRPRSKQLQRGILRHGILPKREKVQVHDRSLGGNAGINRRAFLPEIRILQTRPIYPSLLKIPIQTFPQSKNKFEESNHARVYRGNC